MKLPEFLRSFYFPSKDTYFSHGALKSKKTKVCILYSDLHSTHGNFRSSY